MEQWKDVVEYEGLYEVSTEGRVRNKRTLRMMTPCNNGNGYMMVNLSKNGKAKLRYIHRLVGMAFIPNPENKPEINHKDEDKANNRLENLEWMTHLENMRHGTGMARSQAKQRRKPILQYDLEGNFIREFESTKEAVRQYGSNVGKVLKGTYSQTHGFIFKYKEGNNG